MKRTMLMKLVASNDLKHRMMAEQTVARMNNAMRYKLGEEAKEGLIQALTRFSATDGLSFTNNPFRQVPPRWSFSGMLSRLILRIRRRKLVHDDGALADVHIGLKRSGLFGLIVALAIGLFFGVSESGEPVEISLQMARDRIARTAASGDIVIIAKDDASAERYGGLLWARRYDAQLVDRLREAGVKRIVFNQIMPDATTQIDDSAFAAALNRAKGKVWLSIENADKTNPAMPQSVAPLALFRNKTDQAHGNQWQGMFGQVKHMRPSEIIDGVEYRSKAEILSAVRTDSTLIKPNYAIDYKSIPEISAADIIDGKVDAASLADKTVMIVIKSNRFDPPIAIPGQGHAPAFYSVVIAAETLKRGMPLQLGFLIPLALVAAAGLWWVSR